MKALFKATIITKQAQVWHLYEITEEERDVLYSMFVDKEAARMIYRGPWKRSIDPGTYASGRPLPPKREEGDGIAWNCLEVVTMTFKEYEAPADQ